LTVRPVSVVPNAADAVAADAELVPRSAPASKRLIYMGSFMPYKNVDTLVRATAALPGYELHLLSRIGDAERARLSALAPQASLVFHNGVTDEAYVQVLSEATALVTASLDEGFGIPLVEAMSLGIPVVVSDIEIFREIGGDAASYADASDPDAIADAVRALEQPGEWARRSRLSVQQAARFTWAESARRLLTVLQGTQAAARR
jgi:glycosyltransferase involved in cell wall biosynthesis